MNWTEELINLYEINADQAGIVNTSIDQTTGEVIKLPVLAPIYHTIVTAQITITIDNDGNFINAETVDKKESLTVIPITEESIKRTNSSAAHPLSDNLNYIAGDFSEFSKKDYSKNYECYMTVLKNWTESEHKHKKAEAVYKYISKKSLIADLVKAGVIKLDENGIMSEKEKIQGFPQSEALVRFKVLNEVPEECWEDTVLHTAYINYYLSTFNDNEKEISYISGKIDKSSPFGIKKIRNDGDMAKLITANDLTNFTYRGRFKDDSQAFSIGFTDSQKMHNALKWIIRKQGFNFGTLTATIWDKNSNILPPIHKKTADITNALEDFDLKPSSAVGIQKINTAINKYIDNKELSETILIAFDSATQGRLSVIDYRETETIKYINAIKNWHINTMWVHKGFNSDKEPYYYYGIPSIFEIAETLYGKEKLVADTKQDAETFKRILPCILDQKALPENIINLAVKKASSPIAFKNNDNWKKTLSTACSLIKYQRFHKNNEVWEIELNQDSTDRSYLFGRLLAIADWAECKTFYNQLNWITISMRYMPDFQKKPKNTWMKIELKLNQIMKLNRSTYDKYKTIIEEIFDKFDLETYTDDSLTGLYLLGFYSQKLAM